MGRRDMYTTAALPHMMRQEVVLPLIELDGSAAANIDRYIKSILCALKSIIS